jgi:hypothetical protein
VNPSKSPAFLSYARRDSAFAIRLATDLKVRGANVWVDQLDIRGGQRWDREVEQALSNCSEILIILSPASVESTNVMDEVAFALDERKTVIPILQSDCRIPFRLRRLQQIDFRSDYESGLKGLVQALAVEDQVSLPGAARKSTAPREQLQQEAEFQSEQAVGNRMPEYVPTQGSGTSGSFSGNWTLVGTVLRDIALNWLVLIPLLLCFLMAPRVLFAVSFMSQKHAISHPLNPYDIGDSPLVQYVLPAAFNLLFFLGMLHMWRYLPGVRGLNHSGGDFMKRVLVPLISASFLVCVYDALRFWDSGFHTLSIKECLIGNLAPAAASGVAFLILCGKGMQRLRSLLRLSLAIGLLGVSMGSAQWLVTHYVTSSPSFTWEQYVTIVPPVIGASILPALALFAGLSTRHLEDKDREWLSRASFGILLTSAIWVSACLLVLEAPKWIFLYRPWGATAIAVTGGLSVWAFQLIRRDAEERNAPPTWTGVLIQLVPPVFIISLAISLAILTNVILHFASAPKVEWWDHTNLLENTTWQATVLAQAAFAVMAWIAAPYINITKFSLSRLYRDRLTRAYLVLSNPLRLVQPGRSNEATNGFTDREKAEDRRWERANYLIMSSLILLVIIAIVLHVLYR